MKLIFPVIEDDKHHSPASIAGYVVAMQSLAEGETTPVAELFVAFSDGIIGVTEPSDSRRAIMSVAVGD